MQQIEWINKRKVAAKSTQEKKTNKLKTWITLLKQQQQQQKQKTTTTKYKTNKQTNKKLF